MKKITKLALTILPAAILAAPTLAMADVNQPEEIIDRPRTLPASEMEGSLDLAISGISVAGASQTNEAATLAAGFGITNELEARASILLGKGTNNGGDLTVNLAYKLPASGALSMAVDAGIGYNFDSSNTDALTAGLDLQFKINNQLAVYTPGHQLAIALSGDPKPIVLSIPVGVRYQAANNIFAFLQTNIANISISNSSTAVLFADFIPITVGGFYSLSNKLDVGANFTYVHDGAEDFGSQAAAATGLSSWELGVVARAYM